MESTMIYDNYQGASITLYDDVNKEPTFKVVDSSGNTVYEGKEHPWIDIFERLAEIEARLSFLTNI